MTFLDKVRHKSNTDNRNSSMRGLPLVFTYIEQGEWKKVSERALRHPKEAKVWGTLKKSDKQLVMGSSSSMSNNNGSSSDLVDTNINTPSDLPSSANSSQNSLANSEFLEYTANGNNRPTRGESIHSFASIETTESNLTQMAGNLTNKRNSAHHNNHLSSSLSVSSNYSSTLMNSSSTAAVSLVKCKALHHACHRLRSVHNHLQACIDHYYELNAFATQNVHSSTPMTITTTSATTTTTAQDSSFESTSLDPLLYPTNSSNQEHYHQYEEYDDDPNTDSGDLWIEACKAILTLIQLHPEAAGQRESRHGCLPIHLAVFAMRPTPSVSKSGQRKWNQIHSMNGHDINHNHNTITNVSSKDGNSNNHNVTQGIHTVLQTIHPPPPPPISTTTTTTTNTSPSNKTSPTYSRASPSPTSQHSGTLSSTTSKDSAISGFSWIFDHGNSKEDEVDNNPNTIVNDENVQHSSNTNNATNQNNITSMEELENAMENIEEMLSKRALLQQQNHQVEQYVTNSATATCGVMTNMLFTTSTTNPTTATSSNHKQQSKRPPPISAREVSTGSTNTESSLYSRSSILSTTSTTSKLPSLRQQFNIHQYKANAAKREEYSLKVLNALLDAYPKSVRIDSEGGRFPLHTAVAGRASISIIQTLLLAYPGAARHRTKDGYLPLHLAAYWGVSGKDVGPSLLRVYPDASVGNNRWDRTPLEEALVIAGENGRKHQVDLLRALRRHPDFWSTRIQGLSDFGRGVYIHDDDDENDDEDLDESGDVIPLTQSMIEDSHLVTLIKYRNWGAVIKKVQMDPSEVSSLVKGPVRGSYVARFSPLYLACENNPTYDALDAIVSACPQSITWKKSPGDQLPLHAACTWGASVDVVGFLLAASPSSARQVDSLGNLPLHCACFSGQCKEVIEGLLSVYPEAVHQKNTQGSIPMDVTRRLSHSNRNIVIRLLENVSIELKKTASMTIDDRLQQNSKKSRKKNVMSRKAIPELSLGPSTSGSPPDVKPILSLSKSISGEGENIEIALSEDSNDKMIWI